MGVKGDDLRDTVKKQLSDMLGKDTEPSDGRMRLLKLAIGFLAVEAKLEESEYGDWLHADGDSGSVPAEPIAPASEPGTRRRKERGPNGDIPAGLLGDAGEVPQ